MQQETEKQIAKRIKTTEVQGKNQGHEKWKLSETIVCYSNEYVTDIMDILTKTIWLEAL